MELPHTERLLLRPFQENDLGELREIFGDGEVMRHTGGTVAQESSLSTLHALMRTEGSVVGFWAVVQRKDERVVGRAGFVRGEEDGAPEIVFLLANECWSDGLATELLQGMIAYGKDVLGLDGMIAFARADQPEAVRAMQQAGMLLIGERSYDNGTALQYGWKREVDGK